MTPRRARAIPAVALAVLLAASVTAAQVPPVGADTAAPALSAVVIPALGPGYSVTSQGPLNPTQFASDAPDPSAASGALATLGHSISTYERMWQADTGRNQVQDLLVRFPTANGARVFLRAAQQSLDSGEIVSKGPLASIPDARLVTYFAATDESGVGEAITMRTGTDVALLSFFSAAAGNTQPIAPADAERIAVAQHAAMVSATGGGHASTASSGAHSSAAPTSAKKSASTGDIGWAFLAVVIVALAVATPVLLRRRHGRRNAREA